VKKLFIYNLIRLGIGLVFGAGGLALGVLSARMWAIPFPTVWAVWGLAAILGCLLGYALAPWIINGTLSVAKLLEERTFKMTTQELLGGAIGLIIGLIIANLFGYSASRLPVMGAYVPIVASLLLGYLGWSVGTKRREDLNGIFSGLKRDKEKERDKTVKGDCYKILDTSVIIDGRIADIVNTGFLEGSLVIPEFVLEELRHIADSSDLTKRNRGRRGLDILNKLRKEQRIKVIITGRNFEDSMEVDSKLVKLAQETKGQILTNDFNLNKVAELQGVKVLNINELANALKPVVLPGEEMQVQVIKNGKEMGQGIGYLDDGTMIVVENGRRYLGQTIQVLVTSVLQTAAGRMIFARPKNEPARNGNLSWKEETSGV